MCPPADVAERLEDGTVDILVAPASTGTGFLMSRALMEDGLLTAQRKDHPPGQATLDLDAFCALDHLIVSTDDGGFSSFVDQALTALGRKRQIALSIQSYGLAPLVVAGSDCVCTLPSRLLRRYAGQLDLFEPPLDLPRPRLAAMWHARNQNDQGHSWLRGLLYKAAETSLLGLA